MPFITQGKANITYLLIVIILAVIVGGSIVYWQNNFIKEMEEFVTIEIEREETSSLETANWKTYKGKRLGFELKYPDYFNTDATGESKEDYVSFKVSGERPERLSIKTYLKDFDGFEYANQSGGFVFRYDADIQGWVSSQQGVSQDYAPKKGVTPSGIVYYYVKTSDASMVTDLVFIPYPNKNRVLELMVSRNQSYLDCIESCLEFKPFSDGETYKKILSTLGFVEKDVAAYCSSVSWATYTDYELGFSVQYPKEVYDYNSLVPVKIIKEDKYKTWVAFDENNLWATGISVTVEPAINREEVESFIEKRFSGECVLDSMTPISTGSAIEKIKLAPREQIEGPSSCGAYKLEYYSNLKKIVMLDHNGAPTFFITKDTSSPGVAVFCDPIIWDSLTIF